MLRLTPDAYEAHPQLAVLVTYYNAGGYKKPRENFLRFIDPLVRGGVQVIVIEGRHDGVEPLPAELAERVSVLDVDCESGLWQKERLLNLGLDRLPDAATTVAWLDGDILFTDPGWVPKTVAALDDSRFVQPFDDFVRLPQHPEPAEGMFMWVSYGYLVGSDPTLADQDFGRHGHTGLAWAGRRDLITAAGFYDRWPAGTGDHLMAHAITGTATGHCMQEALGAGSAAYQDFVTWAQKWAPDHGWVAGKDRAVGYVPGAVIHLWHGDYAKRLYPQRESELRALGFDPTADLALTGDGTWRPGDRADKITAFADLLVSDRAEDG